MNEYYAIKYKSRLEGAIEERIVVKSRDLIRQLDILRNGDYCITSVRLIIKEK